MVYLRVDRLPMGERIFLPLADAGSDAANGVLGTTIVRDERSGNPAEVAEAEPTFVPVVSIL